MDPSADQKTRKDTESLSFLLHARKKPEAQSPPKKIFYPQLQLQIHPARAAIQVFIQVKGNKNKDQEGKSTSGKQALEVILQLHESEE